VKITDFGIAHAVGSAGVMGTGLVVGTPGYLAPERAGGATATAHCDLYSLGVVAYECLTGLPPFAGTALEVALAHASRPFPALPASVPADVAALVMQLTAKDPAGRPGSAAEVARQARQVRDQLVSGSSLAASAYATLPAPAGEPRMAGRPTAPGPDRRSSRRRGLAAAGGIAVIVLALVVLVGGTSEALRLALIPPPLSYCHPAEVPGGRDGRCQHRLADRPARQRRRAPAPLAGAGPPGDLAASATSSRLAA
jgi:eukaryotic-like serine/threonine-protein kinase